MTLNTSVVIGSPTNVYEVYAYCRAMLKTPDDVEPQYGPDESRAGHRRGQKWVANPGGIGLDAWLWIHYGADGPMVHHCDEFCDDETHEWVKECPTENGWAAIEVTFDTAYGFRGKNGESCSDLHARLVTALGKWLDSKGLPWKWQNEYTGEWFDRYDGLDSFGNAHRATGADDWFRNLALPAIESHINGGVPDVR